MINQKSPYEVAAERLEKSPLKKFQSSQRRLISQDEINERHFEFIKETFPSGPRPGSCGEINSRPGVQDETKDGIYLKQNIDYSN